MKNKNYSAIKRRHQQAIENFEGIFYAFSDKQFKEGLEKLDLSEGEESKLFKLGSGSFILKDRMKDLEDLLSSNKKELRENLKDEKFLLDALRYELSNHEYSYSGNIYPALDALSLKLEDIPSEILREAKRMASLDE
jgi:predicted DNA-binding antitoxin AbrB/MazE fold protein